MSPTATAAPTFSPEQKASPQVILPLRVFP